MKKLLIIKYGGLGDHVIIGPTLKNIRKQEPDAHITLIASKGCLSYYTNNPYINAIIAAPEHADYLNDSKIDYTKLDALLGDAAIDEYDYLYNPSHDYDIYLSYIVVSRIKAKRKITFRQDRSHLPDLDSNTFYTELLPRPQLSHVAKYQNIFFDKIYGTSIDPFDYQVFYTQTDSRVVSEFIGPELYDNKVIAIHALGSAQFRSLHAAQLSEVAKGLRTRGYTPVLLGYPKVHFEMEGIRNLSGQLSILQSAYLISKCVACICVDSGIKHLAVALNVPICEISHIPQELMHLNGPYIQEQFQYSAIKFWSPNPTKSKYQVIYPDDNNYASEDITSAKCIYSITPESILKSFDELIQ